MNQQETFASQLEWACRNLAHNLDFVPDDKLNWKPSETADSVLGIANQVAQSILASFAMRESGSWEVDYTPLQTRDEVKARVLDLSSRYADALRAMPDSDFEGELETPFGAMSKSFIWSIPVLDAMHHHGQIAYLQTVWGDMDDHYFDYAPQN